MAGVKENISLMKNFLGQLQDGDVDINRLLANAYPSDYDSAARVIRSMNEFKRDHPILSRFGNTQLVDYIDEEAYRIASSSGSPTRSYDMLKVQGSGGNYSGSTDTIDWSTIEGRDNPNLATAGEGGKFDLLRAYLDPRSNTLPVSDVKPSSWTKGDPEQGWRSIKDYSVVEYSDPSLQTAESIRANKGFHHSNPDFVSQLNKLQASVADGTYNPSEHAVKLNVSDAGELPPGMTYQTDIDMANFTQSIGYDADTEEYYMSVTDVWDFEPDQYSENWGVGEVPTEVKFSKWASKEKELYNSMSPGEQASYLKNIQNDYIDRNTQAYGQAKLMAAAGESIGIYDRYTIPKGHIEAWGSWQAGADTTDNIINGLKKLD